MIKYNPSWYIFFILSIFSIILTLSTNNWFIFWMSFEMSVISFLPMISSNSSVSVEMMVKYYTVQAIGSYFFLISNIIMLASKPMMVLMTLSLTMKLGLFPFMYWVPMVMSKISWMTCFFVSTIQKMNPMIVLQTSNSYNILIMLATMSIFLSGMMASNQLDLRSMMAYSSISHSSFIVISGLISTLMFYMYMLIYMFLTWVLFSSFNYLKLYKSSSWKHMNYKTKKMQNILIMSLAGLPPFPLFFFKMMVFFFMCNFSPIYLMLIMTGSLMSVYFYMLLMLPSLIK